MSCGRPGERGWRDAQLFERRREPSPRDWSRCATPRAVSGRGRPVPGHGVAQVHWRARRRRRAVADLARIAASSSSSKRVRAPRQTMGNRPSPASSIRSLRDSASGKPRRMLLERASRCRGTRELRLQRPDQALWQEDDEHHQQSTVDDVVPSDRTGAEEDA